MSIISIDVGIRNLGYCKLEYIENKYKIIKWKVIDLYNTVNYDNDYDVSITYLHWSVDKLKDYLAYKNIDIPIKSSKNKLQQKIKNNLTNFGSKPKLNIEAISRILINFLNTQDTLYNDCSHVFIENQPCLKNPIMKTIQVILYTYFIIKNIVNVQFVNAKLKQSFFKKDFIESQEKSMYKKRKMHSIMLVDNLIKDNIIDIDCLLIKQYNASKKKDDYADSLLQGIAAYSLNKDK